MHTVKPKKFLGQHFLKDLSVARAIADTVDACPDLPILEVGPGMGVMTQYLIPKGRKFKVVEIDFESVAYLREKWPELEDSIIEDDFLKMHLDRTFGGRQFVLTGNYPYNISSQIFFKMLDYKDLIPCCTGMIQKEVAERIAATPGSKTYGILSVLIQAWYSVEYLFTVHEHVFNPPPKVKSAVIRMTRNEVQDLGCDERLFRRVVKTTFNQRRKTLRNNIKPLLTELGIEQLDWSPDGKTIAYTCRKLQGRDYSVSTDADIYLYDVATGTAKNICKGEGYKRPAVDYTESLKNQKVNDRSYPGNVVSGFLLSGYDTNPSFSPDGKYIAWQSMERDGYESDINRLLIMDLKTGTIQQLAAEFDTPVDTYVWSADGKQIYFISTWHGTTHVYSTNLKGEYKQITDGQYDYSSAKNSSAVATACANLMTSTSLTRQRRP